MEEVVSDIKQAKAKKYHAIKNKLFLLDTIVTVAILLAFQLSGASRQLSDYIYTYVPNYYAINALYMVLFSALFAILLLPMNYYSGFYLEHRYQLSNQTIGSWIWDGLKGFALNILFGVIVVEVIYLFLHHYPHSWWILATIFYLFFSVFLSRITPTLILPLFYKLKPLEDIHLKERLVQLAKDTGAKVLGVYQMDMSRKTKKANAMFTGWGKTRRIILGDTLLDNFTDDEIEVVLAHELGHYFYHHIWKLVGVSILSAMGAFYIVHLILQKSSQWLLLRGIDDIAGLPFLLLILFLIFLCLMPFTNGFSRLLECQADRFALNKTKDSMNFISVMKKLASQNLSDENPHPAIEFFLHSHPSIGKRVKMAENYTAS